MIRDDIIYFLRQNKDFLEKSFNIQKIGLYGSFAKNCGNKDSDIDIIINVPKKFKNFKSYIILKEYLESKLHRKIDIIYDDNINPILKENIENEIIYV